uniref:FP protein C-terminal domain-containing protein n=1 Tax=Heliothis virescens TaxID=7102 RepID=A0A2A4JR78_HELVI
MDTTDTVATPLPAKNNDKVDVRSSTTTKQNVTLRKGSVAKKDDLISTSKETLRSIIKEEINLALSNVNDTLIEVKTEVNDTLMEVKTEVTELQKNVKFMNEKYDSIIERISCIEVKTKTINALELEVNDMKGHLKMLNENIEKQEQWGRRSNIEIIGLPEKTGENLIDTLSKLATYAKCPFNAQTDIDFVTRVAHLNKDIKKPKPVVVRFLSRYKKDEFLSRMREQKDLKACDIGYTDKTSRIYFNEHLTSYKKLLLNKVKKITEEKQYKYVWVKNYSILVRKSDTGSVIHISTEDDLKKLV